MKYTCIHQKVPPSGNTINEKMGTYLPQRLYKKEYKVNVYIIFQFNITMSRPMDLL